MNKFGRRRATVINRATIIVRPNAVIIIVVITTIARRQPCHDNAITPESAWTAAHSSPDGGRRRGRHGIRAVFARETDTSYPPVHCRSIGRKLRRTSKRDKTNRFEITERRSRRGQRIVPARKPVKTDPYVLYWKTGRKEL